MKAVIWTKYGPPEVLEIGELQNPAIGSKDILIKIHATTVTAGDCEMRRFDIQPLFRIPVRLYTGIFRPRIKILGQEYAGEVVQIGSEVKEFKIGDAVFGPTQMSLGVAAEFIKISEDFAVTTKPANWTFAEAATIPTGGLNALYFLQKAKIKEGDHILIIGAGGSIGTYAIQIAKYMGAEVTAIDHGNKLSMLRSIGANHVIDYTVEDYSKNGLQYDFIFDIVGTSGKSFKPDKLTKTGVYVAANPSLSLIMKSMWGAMFGRKRIRTGLAPYRKEDLKFLRKLAQEDRIRAMIDRTFDLNDIIDAHHYVETGEKLGNVVIKVSQ